jgi:hypothetical protein
MDIASIVITAVIAGGGAYLGSYLKKKGENWATHEDVDKLVKQMAAVTQATKEIEAKISNDVWERQRKWDVKREAIFEAVRELASVEYGLAMVDSSFLVERMGVAANLKSLKTTAEALEIWNAANLNFNKARNLALLVCGEDTNKAFEVMTKLVVAYKEDSISNYNKPSVSLPSLAAQMNTLTAAVRKELRVD